MPSGTPTDRPFLIPGESGLGEELAASAIREFSDRPPNAFAGAQCAPANAPPPANLWFVRLLDWLSASQTQPRSGDSQQAEGGTIFFQENEDFAAEFQSNPQLGLEKSEPQPKDEQRVILWSRIDDRSTLRAVTIGGASRTKTTKLVCEEPEAEEPACEISFAASRKIPERPRRFSDSVACSLAVWTLWTNPQYQ